MVDSVYFVLLPQDFIVFVRLNKHFKILSFELHFYRLWNLWSGKRNLNTNFLHRNKLAVPFWYGTPYKPVYSTLSQIWFRIQHHGEEKQLLSHSHVIVAGKVSCNLVTMFCWVDWISSFRIGEYSKKNDVTEFQKYPDLRMEIISKQSLPYELIWSVTRNDRTYEDD